MSATALSMQLKAAHITYAAHATMTQHPLILLIHRILFHTHIHV